MSSRERPPKVRHSPRISAPKLGEYIDAAGAGRRHRIIHDQKFPSTFITAHYTDAYNAIRSALTSEDPEARLAARAVSIGARPARSKREADARSGCVAAVNGFARLLPHLQMDGCSFTLPPELGVVIETVPVSVRTCALVQRPRRDGSTEYGGVLVVMRKEAALGGRGGTAVAELLRLALINAGWREVNPKLCLVVDVFSGQIFRPPRGTSRLISDLRSACREIAVLWSTIAA